MAVTWKPHEKHGELTERGRSVALGTTGRPDAEQPIAKRRVHPDAGCSLFLGSQVG